MSEEIEYKQNPIIKVVSAALITLFVAVIAGFTLLMLGPILFILPFQILVNLPMIIILFTVIGLTISIKNYYDHKEITKSLFWLTDKLSELESSK